MIHNLFILNNTKRKHLLLIPFLGCSLFFLITCKHVNSSQEKKENSFKNQSDVLITKANGVFKAYKTTYPIVIDGNKKDAIWANQPWYSMNYIWMGKEVSTTDYEGKFKLLWDSNFLYILVEVVDNFLQPTLANGIENYWKGDYVEVFIDEDKSGGNHQFNHQAFAYHISIEGHIIDKSTAKETVFLDSHITVKRSKEKNKHIWEMAIKIFNNQFDENSSENTPITIKASKEIGFSIAYGDNDGKNARENFMGSKKTHGVNNDEGYINSDVFGTLQFVE